MCCLCMRGKERETQQHRVKKDGSKVARQLGFILTTLTLFVKIAQGMLDGEDSCTTAVLSCKHKLK
jgi:hypothetical protein